MFSKKPHPNLPKNRDRLSPKEREPEVGTLYFVKLINLHINLLHFSFHQMAEKDIMGLSSMWLARNQQMNIFLSRHQSYLVFQ
jgi:hypothetical protein